MSIVARVTSQWKFAMALAPSVGALLYFAGTVNPVVALTAVAVSLLLVFFLLNASDSATSNHPQIANLVGQIDAINKAQAVIEFNIDGTIIRANEKFLAVVGYSLDEIQGQHDSIFVGSEFKASTEYQQFWEKLNRGEYDAREYKRYGKDGQEIWIQASYNPIMDQHGKPFKVVAFATDITQQKVSNINNGRIKQALDGVVGNVMIADIDLNIVYMNNSVSELFNNVESDIRKDLPNFSSRNLMGTCIDLFHKNPAHQRSLLGALKSTHTAEVEIGGRTMQVVANPVFSAEGERLGAVVEWSDRTQEVAIEQEVQGVVDGALRGDLTGRIGLENKDGFLENLSSGVNDLVAVAETVITDTARVLGAIADGKLTETIDADYQGSFEELKNDTNSTVVKLTEVVSRIKVASGSVKGGSDELSRGNADLSQRTEQQASSLEETASSMEEMTSTVKQNADNASEANQLAMAAREQAEKGGSVVSRAVEAMSEINVSSKKISDIIGVIDEIAFQTNLLALNASVEAARAGEQGRGFAVVASEVRNLAGRSATAAKEIKELIVDSGSKVEEGSRLVNESGEVLEEIVNGVKRVTDIVGEIAAASQEQSAGIEEVNKAILQLDELTQQNAALVEQAAAASESMGDQADDLNQMIAFFTVGNEASSQQPVERSTDSHKGADRRSAGRPWSSSTATAAEPQPFKQTPAKVAAAGGNDQEWEEF